MPSVAGGGEDEVRVSLGNPTPLGRCLGKVRQVANRGDAEQSIDVAGRKGKAVSGCSVRARAGRGVRGTLGSRHFATAMT
jgi:hypothetical protein